MYCHYTEYFRIHSPKSLGNYVRLIIIFADSRLHACLLFRAYIGIITHNPGDCCRGNACLLRNSIDIYLILQHVLSTLP